MSTREDDAEDEAAEDAGEETAAMMFDAKGGSTHATAAVAALGPCDEEEDAATCVG